MTRKTATAPAKVNLFLHVVGRRPDGYHELESLVAFADVGDRLEVEVAEARDRAHESESVCVTGPFAPALHDALSAGGRLSVETAWEIVRAAARPRRFNVEVTLEKNLPVASGLGGGTSDAAAMLRALAEAAELGWGDEDLERAAQALGADGPACARAEALMMRGIGEDISLLSAWPDLDVVLVNSGLPVDTRAVFGAYAASGGPFSSPAARPPETLERDVALAYLADARNDLADAAVMVEPSIATVRDALEEQAGVRLTRLSGSGGTVWAVFDDASTAARAAVDLRAQRPGWWVVATRLAGARPGKGTTSIA